MPTVHDQAIAPEPPAVFCPRPWALVGPPAYVTVIVQVACAVVRASARAVEARRTGEVTDSVAGCVTAADVAMRQTAVGVAALDNVVAGFGNRVGVGVGADVSAAPRVTAVVAAASTALPRSADVPHAARAPGTGSA